MRLIVIQIWNMTESEPRKYSCIKKIIIWHSELNSIYIVCSCLVWSYVQRGKWNLPFLWWNLQSASWIFFPWVLSRHKVSWCDYTRTHRWCREVWTLFRCTWRSPVIFLHKTATNSMLSFWYSCLITIVCTCSCRRYAQYIYTHISLSLSLSLSIYIYIYMYIYSWARDSRLESPGQHLLSLYL